MMAATAETAKITVLLASGVFGVSAGPVFAAVPPEIISQYNIISGIIKNQSGTYLTSCIYYEGLFTELSMKTGK